MALEPVLVEVLCTDVGEVVLRRDVMDGNPPLRYQFSDKEEAQCDMCLVLELKNRFPNACRVAVLLQYTGNCANSFPNPQLCKLLPESKLRQHV